MFPWDPSLCSLYNDIEANNDKDVGRNNWKLMKISLVRTKNIAEHVALLNLMGDSKMSSICRMLNGQRPIYEIPDPPLD